MCRLISLKTNFATEVTVADIKMECIKNIVENAAKCSKIEAIVLFGSSLESRCRELSQNGKIIYKGGC